MPTLAHLINIELPSDEQTDGISFLPTLLNKQQQEHEYLYWGFTKVVDDWHCARRLENGCAKCKKRKGRLYNLANDLAEANN